MTAESDLYFDDDPDTIEMIDTLERGYIEDCVKFQQEPDTPHQFRKYTFHIVSRLLKRIQKLERLENECNSNRPSGGEIFCQNKQR